MPQAPQSFGTAFATAGFSFDANLSPNNQAFLWAVLAVASRNGAFIGTAVTPFLPGGGTSGTAVALGTAVFANPTNKVSGTATNGTSTLAMRSDGAPALDWAQSPTWTGGHIFAGPGAQIVVGTSTGYAWGTGTNYPTLQLAGIGAVFGTGTIGIVLTGGGLYFNGTNYVYGQAGTGIIATLGTGSFTVSTVGTSGTAGGTAALTTVFSIGGTTTSNKIQGYGPTATALVDMTPDTGTFTCTITGCTTSPTGVATWTRIGNLVTIALPIITATSNATTLTYTGLPVALQPARTQMCAIGDIEDAGIFTGNFAVSVTANGTITFLKSGSTIGFTNSGLKGLSATQNISYILN